MTVYERETVIKRSPRDVEQHQKKIEETIKEKLYEIIAREDIITSRGKGKVRVPVRFLKDYYFKFEGRVGAGEGEGEGEGEGDKPGDQPGEELYDTEIDIEKLIEWALKECGLPNLKEKKTQKMITSESFKYQKVDFTGVKSLMDKRLTIRESVKRQKSLVCRLMRLTGFSEKECQTILIKAKGNLGLAIEKISRELAKIKKWHWKICKARLVEGKKRGVRPALEKVRQGPLVKKPVKFKIFIQKDDERYRVPEEDIKFHSNAVVFAKRDASGSMGDEKKFLSRMLLFWLVEALRLLYERVEIKFILHTTTAELVSEHDFFYHSESGGTYGGSAHKLAQELEQTKYPSSQWNIYPFHFSDGEDFDPEGTVREALKLLEKSNMFGYGEIQLGGFYSRSNLMETFENILGVSKEKRESGIEVLEKMVDGHLFLGVIFSERKQLWPVLREFLKPEREEWK